MIKKCQVCYTSASLKHFGKISCDACAAFFRRTIKEQKVYNCIGSRKCIIDRGLKYPLCRYCRLKKCLAIGMKISEECGYHDQKITSLLVPITNVQEDLFLDKILKLRLSIEFNRSRIANIRNFNRGEINNVVEMSRSIEYEEVEVLKSFLEYTGLMESLEFFSYDTLIKECITAWIILEASFVNLKHGETKILYYIDENFLRINEDYLGKVYRTDTKLCDPELAARHSMEPYIANIRWIKNLIENKIDMAEYSALTLFVIINLVLTRFDECKFARAKLRPYLNQIFKSLNIYCNEDPNKFTLRLGVITLLIDQFQMVLKQRLEHWHLLKLNGRDFWNHCI